MARNRDNAPIGYTCPKIDQVISFLEKIDWDLEDEDEKDLSIECKEIIEVMEEIRKANDTLRTWGNEEYNSKNEYEEEKDELEKEVKNLKSDLSDMIDEIKYLKAEIETLEERLYDVESVA
jgi:predicted RNase H-like nuclease (RuvC/YqgF family)